MIEIGRNMRSREATMDTTLPDRQKRFFVSLQGLSVPLTHEEARHLMQVVARQLAGLPIHSVEIELLMSTPGAGAERIDVQTIE
jgi:hypothetical protein